MSSTEEIMQTVRENRSSENNFSQLLQALEKATALAQQEGNTTFTEDLQEVKEKYVASYQKAKETGGTAWPEFEKFVTVFERALMSAKED